MILSDREIKAALLRGALRITPDPTDDPVLWSSTALDLRLDRQLSFWRVDPHLALRLRPGHQAFDYDELAKQFLETRDLSVDGFALLPGSFCLGWTLEKIQLPYRSRIAARVEGKSGLARVGIGVHVTAPTIHAGFGFKEALPDFHGNPIQLEIWNVGPNPVTLDYRMKICQIIFELVDGTPEKGYEGKYNVQGPTLPG